jgi:peptidoglycan/LPS O-acetylase OafA/YrhL
MLQHPLVAHNSCEAIIRPMRIDMPIKPNISPDSSANANHGTNRNFGLDVCRAIAILLVVSGHMLQHSNPHPLLAEFGMLGLFGVDLFFCLSGFLIGRILLHEAADWPQAHRPGLLGFWYRRWMRTLPLYFFYLVLALIIERHGDMTLHDKLAYFFFSQNLAWRMPDLFRLSWSLAVEEWFYLTFPICLLFFAALGSGRRRAALLTVAVFLVVPFVFRIFLPSHLYDVTSLDEGTRNIVVFRLDAIGFGVLMAYLSIWNGRMFETLAKFWWLFALVVAGCIAFTKARYAGIMDSPALAPFYFLISAFGFAMLIPKFNSLKQSSFSWLNRFIGYTSKVSYSLYLGHIFSFAIAMRLLKICGIFDKVYPNPWLTYPLFFASAFSVATITYLLVEKPVLKLRDKSRPHASAA